MPTCGVAVLASVLQLTWADDGGGHHTFHESQQREGLQEDMLHHGSRTSESCTSTDSTALLQEHVSTSVKIAALTDSIDELATSRAETSVHTSTSNPEFAIDSNEATFHMDGLMSMPVPSFIPVSKPSNFEPPRVPQEAVGTHQVASPIQMGLASTMTGQADAFSAAWTTSSEMLSTQQKTNLDVVEFSTVGVKQTPVTPFASAQTVATLSAGVALSLLEAGSRLTAVVVAKGTERVQSNPGLAVSCFVGATAISSVFAYIVFFRDNAHGPDGKACASQPEASTVDETEGNVVFSESPAAAPRRKPFVPSLNSGNMGFPEPTERAESVSPSAGVISKGYDDNDDRPSMILGISPSLSQLPRLRDWVQQQTTRQKQGTPSSPRPSQMVPKSQSPQMNENRPSCDPRRMSSGPSLRSSLTGETLALQSGISPSPVGTQSSLASSQGRWFRGSQMRQAMAPPMPSVPSESFFQS